MIERYAKFDKNMSHDDLIKFLYGYYRLPDHPKYGVNRKGEICNIDKKTILSPIKDSRGFLRVRLDGKRELISRIVASRFIPNPENKPNVIYRDGDRSHVNYDNLVWASNSETHKRKK